MSWRYYEAADGRRFCYAVHPTYDCPLGKRGDLREVLADVAAGKPPDPAVGRMQRAAEELGVAASQLARLIYRAHLSGASGRRRDGEKLTDRCKVCGAKMDRLGFRCWIERPYTEQEGEDPTVRTTHVLNEGLLGFRCWIEAPLKTVKSFYVDTRREARDWALEEFRMARAAAAETGG